MWSTQESPSLLQLATTGDLPLPWSRGDSFIFEFELDDRDKPANLRATRDALKPFLTGEVQSMSDGDDPHPLSWTSIAGQPLPSSGPIQIVIERERLSGSTSDVVSTWREAVAQHCVPWRHQYRLLTRMIWFASFSDLVTRRQWIAIRLLALSLLRKFFVDVDALFEFIVVSSTW